MKKPALKDMPGTCASCRHFKAEGETGDCHRYPPTVVVGTDSEGEEAVISVFAYVDSSDWCGEFSPKN